MKKSLAYLRKNAVACLLLVAGTCMAENTSPLLTITSGACGKLLPVRRMAEDFPSALTLMKDEISRSCPVAARPCRIETREVKVANGEGASFRGLMLLGKDGVPVEAMHQVLSSDGILFSIQWCPD